MNDAGHPFRTLWLDPDFRREAATDHRCVVCGRALAKRSPFRKVLCVSPVGEADLPFYAVHAEDWPAAMASDVPADDRLIGPDCATRLGLEWSVPA